MPEDPSWRRQSSLFWSSEKRELAYRNIEKIYPTNTVRAGKEVKPLELGTPLTIGIDLDAYVRDQYVAGLIILHRGKVVLEKYARGYNASGRWLSRSVAKSVTSMLVGAAIQDGLITSVEDPITNYLPDLKGSAYDGVTLRQVLTMTSGVKWNEDYTDPNSDVVKYGSKKPKAGLDLAVTYMRKLPREAPPGSKWAYKTGETHLIGAVLRKVTGKSLADYLSEKIWQPYGMEQDAVWQLSKSNTEMSGCCMAVSLRDYARFGQFVLKGGKARGKQVVPGKSTCSMQPRSRRTSGSKAEATDFSGGLSTMALSTPPAFSVRIFSSIPNASLSSRPAETGRWQQTV